MADRDYAFKTLDSVVSGNAQSRTKTVWSIVYDIAKRRVYYRTHKNPNLRWVSMEDFDFSPEVSARYLDINADGEGHVAEQTQVLTHVGAPLLDHVGRRPVMPTVKKDNNVGRSSGSIA